MFIKLNGLPLALDVCPGYTISGLSELDDARVWVHLEEDSLDRVA